MAGWAGLAHSHYYFFATSYALPSSPAPPALGEDHHNSRTVVASGGNAPLHSAVPCRAVPFRAVSLPGGRTRHATPRHAAYHVTVLARAPPPLPPIPPARLAESSTQYG